MSLSSARKGRPNNARNEDENLGDRLRVVGNFRDTIHEIVGVGVDYDTFFVRVELVAGREAPISANLDENLAIEDGTTVPRGALSVYRWELIQVVDGGREFEVAAEYVVAQDAPVLDLVRAPIASEAEIAEAVAWEPPEPAPPAPIVFKTIARQPGDSFLGFAIGSHEQQRIDLAARWTVLGFHVPSPQVVGKLKVSVDFVSFCGRMRVRVFDAAGESLLDINMSSDEERFDHVRLPAGDYLLALRPSSSLTGTGSYYYRNARTLTNLPEKPRLDEVLWPNEDSFMEGNAPRCGVPHVLFSSR